jgi:hypothetical protein
LYVYTRYASVPVPPAAGVNVIFTPPELLGRGKLNWVKPLALKFDPLTTKILPCAIFAV